MLETKKSAGKTLKTHPKLETVRHLIEKEGYSISQTSRETKLDRRTISRWISKFGIHFESSWRKTFPSHLTKLQTQVLRGTILGDGCLYQFKTCKYPTLMIYHSMSQKEYVRLKFEIFKNLIPNKIIKKATNRHRLYFNTCSNRCFNATYKEVYNGKRKVVRKSFLDKLDTTSLAFWFMDDGSRCKNRGLALHTNSFSLEEVEQICCWFRNKFAVICNPQKRFENQWVVFFSAKTSEMFAELLLPHIIPSMRYKFKGVFLKNPQRLHAVPLIKAEDIV